MNDLFSKRYNYQEKKLKKLDEIDEAVKNRIWNLFLKLVESMRKVVGDDRLIVKIWDEFFKGRIDELKLLSMSYLGRGEIKYQTSSIKDKFFQLEWYRYYDFLEYLMKIEMLQAFRSIIAEEANKIFEEENIECKIINNLVVPIIAEEEIKEIEAAQKISDRYSVVKIHLQKAIESYAKRPQPDYKNSIKESISAIEALARIITNNPSADLGDLTKQLPIHPAFKDGLNKIYGWTSDEGGIRHSHKDYQYQYLESGEDEARFMLVLAHTFVNYIIKKHEQQ
jgi:hypothetical protein